MSRAVVYCQLQHDLPRCFWASLKKTRELWDGDIYLIAPQRERAYTALDRYGVKFVAEHSIGSELIKEYEYNTFFNTIHIGWDGFWDNACKRFLYLYEVKKSRNIDELLHFETDVIPYLSVNDMFDKFGKAYSKKIVFSPHAPYQISCCTIFCNAIDIFEKFCNSVVEYFKRKPDFFYRKYPTQTILNETHFAYTFQQENPNLVDLFPTIPGEKNSKEFGFLIDSTAWGMWIDGLHYNPGFPFATVNHNIGKLILNGVYAVTWKDQLPYITGLDDRHNFPLATLHFNSKTPEKWI